MRQRNTMRISFAALAGAATAAAPAAALANVQYFIQGTNWPADKRAAAVAAMDAAVGRYNAHGGFTKTINVYYEPTVATADASFNGTLRFGPNIAINERVALHEVSHTLGVGTVSAWDTKMTAGTWDGAQGLARVRQFEGLQSPLNGDGSHFWPYGLNFDNEASANNNARHVAMVYAMRADMGLGPAAHPSTAKTVTLTGGNPLGESGFNWTGQWSDGHFAHAGAAYSTGNFALRTPASGNSFTFAGDSLTVNNTADVTGGLAYKGTGNTGVIRIDNLVLNGGLIEHRNGVGDLFQLDGKLTVASPSTIRAKQGNIDVLADLHGTGDLTIPLTDEAGTDNRYVRLLAPDNTFTGDVNVAGRFQLAAGANHRFVVAAGGASNAITGAARRVLLDGVFQLDLTAAAGAAIGDSWSLVTAANTLYGDAFRVDGFTEDAGVWSNGSRYVFSEATGKLSVVPEPASLGVLAAVAALGLAPRHRLRRARPADRVG